MTTFSCETHDKVISECDSVSALLIAAYTHVSEGEERLDLYIDGEKIGTAHHQVTIQTTSKRWKSWDTVKIELKRGLLDEED